MTFQQPSNEVIPARIWTDGSVGENQTNRGSGAIIVWNNRDQEETTEIKEPAGSSCSNYISEMKAIMLVSEKIKRED